MAQVHGYCDPRFTKVRDLMSQFLASGQEIGASFCVNLDGTTIIDLWGGFFPNSPSSTSTFDPLSSNKSGGDPIPWSEHTVVPIFSTTKLVTNLAILMLFSRGLAHPSDTVAKHWPAFAAAGKQDITIAQVLSHSAGVPGWTKETLLEQVLFCHDEVASRLAAQEPWWDPGTKIAYHAITQGVIVAEIVRQLTGKSLAKFVQEELAGPLDADFSLGAPEDGDERKRVVSSMIPPEGIPIQETLAARIGAGTVAWRVLFNPFIDGETANSDIWKKGTAGSLSGYSNARGLVRILGCFALGGRAAENLEKQVLRPEFLDAIFKEYSCGEDLVTGGKTSQGLGVYLSNRNTSIKGRLPEGKVAWGAGWGGSAVLMDADRGLTIGYAMNKMRNENFGSPCPRAYFAA